MGRWDSYVTGKLEIEIANEKLELDISMGDKRKLKTVIGEKRTQQEKEDAFKLVDDVLLSVLKKSYPEEKPEAIEGLYNELGDELFTELLYKFKWIDRDTIETVKKKELEKQNQI